MSARKAAPFTVPEHLRPNAAGDFNDWLDSVERAGGLAIVMVSQGIFSIDDPSVLDSLIAAVAEQHFDAKKHAAQRERFERQIHAEPLSAKQKRALIELSDLGGEEVMAHAEAGYLLGLAVGQRVDLRKMGGAR